MGNLDHTLKHRDLFRDAGDQASAAVLQRIHDEEVRHVRLARVWMKRLARSRQNKDWAEASLLAAHAGDGAGVTEHKEDVDLYEEFAAFPPFEMQKARGRPMLAVQARRRAGFSERFIAEVRNAQRR